MNVEKTKAKLKKLSNADIEKLLSLVTDEMDSRAVYMSNTTHTPNEIANQLHTFFSNAWIH